MKRFVLLIGSFLVTFVLLISVWMVGTGRSPFGGLAATPSPAPTAAPTSTPVASSVPTASSSPTTSSTASPSPSPNPSASATPSATNNLTTPSPSPAPMRTPPPSSVPQPSGQPGGNSETYTLLGKEFTTYEVPEGGSLLLNGDALVLRTIEDSPDALWVVYSLDPARLPAGATVYSISTAVCGYSSGQFWEVYGPSGSDPLEYEVTPPDADGCWYFRDAYTNDISAIAATMLESTMVIERVVFTVTFSA